MAQRHLQSRTSRTSSDTASRPTVPFTVPEAVLKGQAKRLLTEMRRTHAGTTLSQAQALLARVWNETDWPTLLHRRAQRGTGSPNTDPARTGPAEAWSLSAMNPMMLTSLLERWVSSPDADAMWSGRAKYLLRSVVPALMHALHEDGNRAVSPAQLLEGMGALSVQNLAHRRTLPPAMLDAVRSYLQFLPGYRVVDGWPDGLKNQMSDAAFDHHGYLLMQLTRPLQTLQDLMPNLGMVVWRRAWPLDLRQEDPRYEVIRGSWLDRQDRHALPLHLLQGPGTQPQARVLDLVERMAFTLSDDDAIKIRHWLERAIYPSFVTTAQTLDHVLTEPTTAASR